MTTAMTGRSISKRAIGGAGALLALALLSGCGGWGSYAHEAATIVELEAEPTNELRVEGDVGDIRIVSNPDRDTIHAIVQLVGKGHTPEQAKRAMAELSCEFVTVDGVLTGRLVHPKATKNTPYEGRWSIEVPEGLSITVRNDVGDVNVFCEGSDVDVRTDVGDVWIGAAANADAFTDVGAVWISASGRIAAQTDVGDVSAYVLGMGEHEHSVRSDVGDVSVTLPPGWSGKVTASTDVGDSLIDDGVGGRVTSDDKASMRLGDAGAATLHALTDVGDAKVITGTAPDAMGTEPAIDVPGREQEPQTREPALQ